LEEGNKYNSTSLKLLLAYPNIIKEFGDNSDNKPVNFPLRKILKRSFIKPLRSKMTNNQEVFNSLNTEETTSNFSPFFSLNLKNSEQTSKDFMVNYAFQSIPFGKQSIRKHKNLNPNTTNYNLSLGLNSLDSNLQKLTSNSNYLSPLYMYSLQNAN